MVVGRKSIQALRERPKVGGAVSRTPFTVVDETLLRCDRAEEPQTVQLEVRVAGSVDARRLGDAVKDAVARHPMARVSKATRRRLLSPPLWEIHDPAALDVERVLSVAEAQTDTAMGRLRDAFYSQGVDVSCPPPFRLTLVARPGGDTILFTFNHAAADGIGALRLLQSVANSYAGRPHLAPVDDVALRHPVVPRAPKRQDDRPTDHHRSRPPGRPARPAFPRPSLIAASPAAFGPGYRFHQSVVPGLSLASSHPTEPGPRITVNDLLVASLHQSISEWNSGRGVPCERVLVLLPVSMRPEALRLEIVGNCLSSSIVATDPDDRREPQRLLRTVVAQTLAAKAGGAATPYRRPAWARQVFPLLMPVLSLPVLRRRWQTAAVVSNVGTVDGVLSFGPLDSDSGRITECWAAAPNFMPMGLSVGAATVDGRLCLALRCRRALFDAEDAAAFAGLFERQLMRLLDVREAMRAGTT
ncbi:MAG: hypothetical protein ACRD2W_15485 [Acidimicrobiales bacterium]